MGYVRTQAKELIYRGYRIPIAVGFSSEGLGQGFYGLGAGLGGETPPLFQSEESAVSAAIEAARIRIDEILDSSSHL
jgi:hypothetical protein